MKKGEKGYIARLKKKDILFILVNIMIAAIIFLLGLLIWDNKANLATIIAVCSLLPGCKRIVNLILILPFKGISQEDYKLIIDVFSENKELKSYTDMLFATERCFLLFEHATLGSTRLIAYSGMTKDKNDFAEEYLNDGFQKRGIDIKVSVYSDIKEYTRAGNSFGEDCQIPQEAELYLESLFI